MAEPSTSPVRASLVSKSFPAVSSGTDDIHVLREVSLSVRPGEMLSIVGPSGSGKSTLLYCLAGLERVSSGTVELLGTDLARVRPARAAVLRRDHVGFIFQSLNLIDSLTVRENVALPARLARRRVDMHRIDSVLASVGLDGHAQHRPGELSGGQRQRVAIARVLVAEPSVVFADEPTGSLDGATGTEILRLLRAQATDERSVVMVTHDLEAAALADRVLVLRDGAIHAELESPTPDAVLAAVQRARTAGDAA